MPGVASICLGFDDAHLAEWAAWIPDFARYGMRCTFYLSGMGGYGALDWDAVRRLQDAGHTIGCHTMHHSRAGLVGTEIDRSDPRLTDEIAYPDFGEFLSGEIWPALELLDTNGAEAHHYAYPFGNHSNESDEHLLEIFETVRIGGTGIYGKDAFPRVFAASNYGSFPDQPTSRHNKQLAVALDTAAVVCYLMHEPIASRLHWLGRFALTNGMRWVTPDDFYEPRMETI